jgi:hypothetical protein
MASSLYTEFYVFQIFNPILSNPCIDRASVAFASVSKIYMLYRSKAMNLAYDLKICLLLKGSYTTYIPSTLLLSSSIIITRDIHVPPNRGYTLGPSGNTRRLKKPNALENGLKIVRIKLARFKQRPGAD